MYQVNLEYLARVVLIRKRNGRLEVLPETMIGTDSHTTMINGLGVLGWGVGGIEAEAVMLGQSLRMLLPKVVGGRLTGCLSAGVTATDLTLALTARLRKMGVVEKIVEYFGPGLAALSLPDRATVANMAPEYGATAGFFPVDDMTLNYLACTGRPPAEISLVERYCKAQGLFSCPDTPDPQYTDVIDVDLASIEPCIAGPRHPHDVVALKDVGTQFRRVLSEPVMQGDFGLPPKATARSWCAARLPTSA